MLAIYKRDFKACFTSPIGYVFCGLFLCIFSIFFQSINVSAQLSDMSNLFSNMLLFTMFLVPLLTMRIFSEEYKQKTDQLLFTAPVKLTGIVIGKFFALITVFLCAMCVTLIYSFIVAMYGSPMAGTLIGNYVAYTALTASFFSMGIFFSSLTESQVVSAIISWGVFLGVFLLDTLSTLIPFQFVRQILSWLSFFARYDSFSRGVFSLEDVIFYLSVCAVFLFLTVRVLEKKRWS